MDTYKSYQCGDITVSSAGISCCCNPKVVAELCDKGFLLSPKSPCHAGFGFPFRDIAMLVSGQTVCASIASGISGVKKTCSKDKHC